MRAHKLRTAMMVLGKYLIHGYLNPKGVVAQNKAKWHVRLALCLNSCLEFGDMSFI